MKLVTKLKMTNQDYILIMEAGFAMLTAGRIEEALDIFYGCHDMLPDSELPLIGISRCYSRDGKLLRAEEWARRATKARLKSAIAWFNLAEILLMQGKRSECSDILNKNNDCDLSVTEVEWKKSLIKLLGVDSGIKNRVNKK